MFVLIGMKVSTEPEYVKCTRKVADLLKGAFSGILRGAVLQIFSDSIPCLGTVLVISNKAQLACICRHQMSLMYLLILNLE